MGSIFSPKMPAPPPLVMPEPEKVPEADDAERIEEEDNKLKDIELKRKGRRSTILTGTGLSAVPEEDLNKKTLLGG